MTDSELQSDSPCSQPEAAQFDFWLGEWDLTWDDGGRGNNTITKTLGDCVILEQFDSAPGDTFQGMSVSTFNQRLGLWQQTWVDNTGNYLDFVGGWQEDRMILSRAVEHEGAVIRQRMVWFNIAADELDWHWQRSRDGGASWETLWHIHYRRR